LPSFTNVVEVEFSEVSVEPPSGGIMLAVERVDPKGEWVRKEKKRPCAS